MSGPDRGADRPLPPEIADPSPFAEPWQAQAFALVVGLHERGLFEWGEWAQALSAELKRPGVADDGSDYYACWLRALETLIGEKQIAEGADIDALAESWSRAAHATPHGKPILLENDPLTS
ncbi:nitrile hydratase accessory protein [Nitratireductor sp. XY-223]|uniref:nitrile hydratase accessory protein n=1 Tax=Nitratireductor sp. XY-223 TaxID=2561926 RepID=UPI001FEF4F94|nr:nitrile hydratase accessory protein [Nitratireductor sp. XY-223]